jgi:hypothetical protein
MEEPLRSEDSESDLVETPLPSGVEVEEVDGELHYRIPTWNEARHPPGKGTRPERSWLWHLGFLFGLLVLDGVTTWRRHGIFLPCSTLVVLPILLVLCWVFVERESQREIILTRSWVGFRSRLGLFRWTQWVSLRSLERFVVQPTDDFEENFIQAVAGSRTLSFEWFGEWKDLDMLVNHLSAQCERFRGGIPMGKSGH